MTSDNKLFLEKLFDRKMANSLPKDDDVRVLGEFVVDLFDNRINFLRQQFPNNYINEICTLLWRLIGNNMIPFALTEQVKVLTFAAEENKDRVAALVMCPMIWPDLCKDDPIMQQGAIVFVASQARDFYNGIRDKKESTDRAIYYESKFLQTVQQNSETFTPNKYQKKVLEYAGNLGDLHYESKPFELGPRSVMLDGL